MAPRKLGEIVMRILLAAAALLPLASPAGAQQWYHVGGNDNTQSYVDLASLRPLADKIIGDVESVYIQPIGEGIIAARIRTEFNCQAKTFRTLEYSFYAPGGKFLRTEPSETLNEIKTPKPNSINESIMDFACLRKGGTAVANPFTHAPTQF
ncbi:surface-adhesin E family protein [Sphingomonas sp. OTU376]|uniref:surface-adhesin E family protein n=2 Tax=unclassified Sphingomonas TaxID=196159 RepID=UPI00313DBAB1|eukprot:TRINITY_DN67900_c0_g1_i1.p2 TRINITY_DN67900_c0_g1~~TRINITY_DN67900_c0_g1_i1.p2  ORF type:complete len:152 (-),score=30.47 TRINITY_DN67900_c0_g1_i1:145-600(-)